MSRPNSTKERQPDIDSEESTIGRVGEPLKAEVVQPQFLTIPSTTMPAIRSKAPSVSSVSFKEAATRCWVYDQAARRRSLVEEPIFISRRGPTRVKNSPGDSTRAVRALSVNLADELQELKEKVRLLYSRELYDLTVLAAPTLARASRGSLRHPLPSRHRDWDP